MTVQLLPGELVSGVVIHPQYRIHSLQEFAISLATIKRFLPSKMTALSSHGVYTTKAERRLLKAADLTLMFQAILHQVSAKSLQLQVLLRH